MRNCLYNGEATKWLKKMAESEPFLRATGGSLDKLSMRDREAINRFCAFKLLGWRKYQSGDMDSFLAEALTRMNKMTQAQLKALGEQFDVAMDLNFNLFGQHAFRKSLRDPNGGRRSPLNIAFFEVCSVLFAEADRVRILDRSEKISEMIHQLILTDQDFEPAITYATNSRDRVERRFRILEAKLSEVLA
jgi:hypothetical protein